MDALLSPENWIGLITLTTLEVGAGRDNIVFISILAGKLPPAQQAPARRTGLLAAMLTRLLPANCSNTDGCASRGLL